MPVFPSHRLLSIAALIADKRYTVPSSAKASIATRRANLDTNTPPLPSAPPLRRPRRSIKNMQKQHKTKQKVLLRRFPLRKNPRHEHRAIKTPRRPQPTPPPPPTTALPKATDTTTKPDPTPPHGRTDFYILYLSPKNQSSDRIHRANQKKVKVCKKNKKRFLLQYYSTDFLSGKTHAASIGPSHSP